MKVRVKVGPNGTLPTLGTPHAAGWDIYAAEDGKVQSGEQRMVHCDIFLAIEDGWFADVRPRSGLAAKQSISITNSPGTIDSDYRGEVMVCLRNNKPAFAILLEGMCHFFHALPGVQAFATWIKSKVNSDPFEFKKGDRIAQLVFHEVAPVAMLPVESLDETARGAKGFGSTGL